MKFTSAQNKTIGLGTSLLVSKVADPKEAPVIEILIRPKQPIDGMGVGLSKRTRVWTLVVACTGIAMVISSMIALNTALGDIAALGDADTADMDRRRLHPGARRPAPARRRNRRPPRDTGGLPIGAVRFHSCLGVSSCRRRCRC
jgi:hypothetical protein